MSSNSTLFKAMKENMNDTVTTNGMKAYKSTLDDCLDLFCTGASCRHLSEPLKSKVLKAYNADKVTCLRILFYLRDIRGKSGQGERNVFRTGMREILQFDYKTILDSDILIKIPEYGRWDDLISLWGINSTINEEIGSIVNVQLKADMEALEANQINKISLLAKWMPSCNTSSKKTRDLARELRRVAFPAMPEKIYRQILSSLRKAIDIVETHLAKKDYTFDYSKLPSKASLKYKKAFMRNDGSRYQKYVDKLTQAIKTGENPDNVKVNVGTLYPYEIIKPLIHPYRHEINSTELAMMDNRWKSLPDYFENSAKKGNWLAMADVSGSMTWPDDVPMAASVSLAMYIAEHNTGIFKNQFITFHSKPSLCEINPNWTIDQKVREVKRDGYCGSTNITAAFDCILKAAITHKISASEMPQVLVIISDMQFDQAVINGRNESLFNASKQKFNEAGYELPHVVFWNVAYEDYGNLPVTKHVTGASIINGCKPGTFDMLMEQKTPLDFMNAVLEQERYRVITLG